jgi:dihydroxyacetone kinase-like protein
VTRSGADVAAAWVTGWAGAVHERREWLTDLDAAIGDGDHGINLDRGLVAVAADLRAGPGPADTAGTILTATGRRLLSVVGGASGALYGRAFVRAGEAVAHDGDDSARLAETALAAAIEAITGLGKAVPGEKTMLDALVPALDALRATATELPAATRVEAAAAGAEAGALATVPLLARKGRASYLGDRSVGHMDPGAASAALLVRCLATAVDGH